MNASASRGSSIAAVGEHATPSNPSSVSPPDARALEGWLTAGDHAELARSYAEWGVTLASSIARAIDAGLLDEARSLASILQFVADHQFSGAEYNSREAKQKVETLRAGGQ